jgi:hypothetical protein
VLGHLEAAFTQVEDVTNLAAGDRSSAQRSPAVSAVGGDVGNHLVGIGDLDQILAWITRLLARVATRLALGSPAGGSLGPLLASFCIVTGRKKRGVVGVATGLPLNSTMRALSSAFSARSAALSARSTSTSSRRAAFSASSSATRR